MGRFTREKGWTFGAWLTLAVAILWTVNTLVLSMLILQYPSDGWSSVREGPTGFYGVSGAFTTITSSLRDGDRVIAVNGQPLTADGLPALPRQVAAGDMVHYTVDRAGQTVEVDVTLVQSDRWAIVLNTLSRLRRSPEGFIVSLVSLLIALFAFLARPRDLGARYLTLVYSFFFASTWFGFSVPGLYAFTWPPALTFAATFLPFVWWWYFFPSLALMALAFPVIKAPLRRFPRLTPALVYGVPLTLCAVGACLVVTTRDYAPLNALTLLLLLITLLAGVTIFGSIIHNWVTVREPVARAQMRWVALGLGGGLGLMIILLVVVIAPKSNSTVNEWNWIGLVMLLVPISLAVAITRHRLFDIDVIIRRTLVYSVVTVLLAVVYFGGVVLLQSVFEALTGQNSPLAVVASTLAIAALFTPLRRLVQDAVDRRFYRRRYNAQQVLDQFAATVRDEVELSELTEHLLTAVEETMQPAHVSLWLRADTPGQRRPAPVER